MEKTKLKDYYPLFAVYAFILIGSFLIELLQKQFTVEHFMLIIMGLFFLVFGIFKLLDLKGFVEGYRSYDLLAKKIVFYAWIYPFIEIVLGIIFLLNLINPITLVITFVLSIINCLGIFIELSKGHKVQCACLGTIIKVPLTNVSLVEYLLMGFMALIMLVIR